MSIKSKWHLPGGSSDLKAQSRILHFRTKLLLQLMERKERYSKERTFHFIVICYSFGTSRIVVAIRAIN